MTNLNQTNFNREIQIPTSSLTGSVGSLRLATYDTKQHLNIILSEGTKLLNKTLSPDQAKQLRDALIEAYPITTATTRTTHRIVFNGLTGKYDIVREVHVNPAPLLPLPKKEVVASVVKHEDALIISKAYENHSALMKA